MKHKSLLVCFTGIDGSGKTTHAKYLKKYLEEQGYSCGYVWGASRPFFSYFFFVFTRALGYWKCTKRDAYTDPLEFAPKPLVAKLGKIWRFFLFVDYQLKALIKIRVLMAVGKIVVCDRYFYDLLMELQLSNLSSKNFTSLLSKTMPIPSTTFLLDVAEVLASHRRRSFTKEFFFERRKIFLEMANTFEFVIVDSSKDFLENQHRIRQDILKRLKNG
jgi:dTMP kinase